MCAVKNERRWCDVFVPVRHRSVRESIRYCAHSCEKLSQRLLHGKEINGIISKCPELKRFHGRRLGSYYDSSSQRDWSGDLKVKKIDYYQQWIFGRTKACELLDIDPTYFHSKTGYSMLRPNKRLVGVTVDV